MDEKTLEVLSGEEEDQQTEVFRSVMRSREHPTEGLGRELASRFYKHHGKTPHDAYTNVTLIELARTIVICENQGPEDLVQPLMAGTIDLWRGTPQYDKATAILQYLRHYSKAFVYDPTWIDRILSETKPAETNTHPLLQNSTAQAA